MCVCVSCAPDRSGGSLLGARIETSYPPRIRDFSLEPCPLDSTVGTSIHFPTSQGFPEEGGECVGKSVPTSQWTLDLFRNLGDGESPLSFGILAACGPSLCTTSKSAPTWGQHNLVSAHLNGNDGLQATVCELVHHKCHMGICQQ